MIPSKKIKTKSGAPSAAVPANATAVALTAPRTRKTATPRAKKAPEKPELAFLRRCLELIIDKKAVDPVVLDLSGLSTITDHFIICSVQSEPQLKAIANHLEKTLKDEDQRRPFAVDGFPASQWVVVDYGEVMIHIFHESKRPLYALEELWGDAPRVKFDV